MVVAPNVMYVALMDNPRKAPQLGEDYRGLALVDFSIVPHFGNSPFKKVCEQIVATYKDKTKLIPISNTQVVTVSEGTVSQTDSTN